MKRKFTLILFELIPLFAGLFAIQSKPAPINLESYAARYLSFILLYLCWLLFREAAPRIFPEKTSDNVRTLIRLILTGLLAALLIATTFLFKEKFNPILYESALVIIGLDAFAVRFRMSEKVWRAWLCGLFAYTGLSYLSFQMSSFSIDGSTLLFSVAIGSVPLALQTSEQLFQAAKESHDRLMKLLTFTLIAGPLCVGFLVFINDLPRSYLTSFILLPIIANQRSEDRSKIFWFTAIMGLLFIVNLGALAILT